MLARDALLGRPLVGARCKDRAATRAAPRAYVRRPYRCFCRTRAISSSTVGRMRATISSTPAAEG